MGNSCSRLLALVATGSICCLAGPAVLPSPAFAAVGHQHPRTTVPGCTSQSTANGQWVCAVYETVLNRPADSGGQAKWDSALAKGASRYSVAYPIVTSTEYRTDFIQADYQAYLGRDADSTGLNSLLKQFANGATDEQVDSVVLGSAEFYSKSDGTNRGFVDAVYQDVLGRPADSAGQSKWGTALADGQSRGSVAYDIDVSQESRTDSVEFFYQSFFNRPADSAGLQHWVGQLDKGITDESVMSTLLASQEFYSDVTGS